MTGILSAGASAWLRAAAYSSASACRPRLIGRVPLVDSTEALDALLKETDSDDGVPSWDKLVRIFKSCIRTASSQVVQDEDAPYEIDRDQPRAP